jgi:hypothetical protein
VAYVLTIPNGQSLTRSVLVANENTNLFCSGSALMADGRVFVTGGHNGKNYFGVPDVNIFDWRTNAWRTVSGLPAADGRWYAGALTLPDGDMLALSGLTDGQQDPNKLPQVWETANDRYRDLTGAVLALKNYPKIFVAPNGLVFDAGPEVQTRFLDTSGTGQWTNGPAHRFGPRTNGSAAMYEPGKILYAGGAKSNSVAPVNTCEVIDLNGGSLAWRSTGAMHFARRLFNATVLPDGTVLAVGGSTSALFNDAAGAVLPAELWNPATGTWTTLAGMAVPRIYHSNALLLPDGRVLSIGGGKPAAAHGGKNNTNGEIYSPPYLFKGPRPAITSAPTEVGFGQTFKVGTPDAAGIDGVVAMRLSTVTHTHNTGQRRVPLGFTRAAGGLNVTAPSDRTVLLAGHYMLFVLKAGVPSVASIIHVG